MKNILIPTDFSQNAKKATDYALSLFNEQDITITLLNVFYIPYASADVVYSYSYIANENVTQLFKHELERINKKFPDLKAKIKTSFHAGDVINVVCSIEKKEKIDLIVMGTQGASGLAEVFMGSRTTAMIKNVKTPVLAVPEQAQYKPAKRILFAAGEKLIGQKVNIAVLKEIANRNQSKIEALYVSDCDENKESMIQSIDGQLNLNFGEIPCDLIVKDGLNVEKEIQKYAEQHPIDLMAMITSRGSIFHESVTKLVAMHTKLPLLVMHTNTKTD